MAWEDSAALADGAEDGNRGGATEAPLTVSAAMALAKTSLESLVVRLVGEVSEVSVKPGYKAAYFTVKDSGAALPCMMWNNRYRASGVDLAVGQLVELSGRFTLYAAKGRMNFDVFSISLAGEGDLRMKVANIAKRLSAEGLTDPSRKRAIPAYPERVGLVTSPRSAAVHDVLRTFRRRFPLAEILLAGVPVEGARAPADIAEGIRRVVAAGAQVVLVVRGGGSFEDMMPFNDEKLARTIAACPVPVVTGIGHEVDTSIADMVSDFRASTPTAAAEAVSPSREQLDALFANRTASLDASMARRIERLRSQLDACADRPMFRDPALLFAGEWQGIDYLSEKLSAALPRRLEKTHMALDSYGARMTRAGATLTGPAQASIRMAAARLQDLSPLNTLARGYSIVRDGSGSVISSVDRVGEGDAIDVAVSDGVISCEVVSTAKSNQ